MKLNRESEINLPPELKIAPVEHLPEYVIGFPVYVAITVRAGNNVSFNKLLFADILDLRDCIGLKANGPAGEINYQPKPFINEETGAFGERLESGESRRMLTDVSSLFGNNLTPGEYVTRFSFVTPNKKTIEAAPVRIRFRPPTVSEKSILTTLAADREKFPNWALWTISPPSDPTNIGNVTADNPLKFNLLLRRLFFGTEPLERVNTNILDILKDIYEPERNALKAELFKIRDDSSSYERLKMQVLSNTPGLIWWFKMLDGNGAYLKTFRQPPEEDD